MSVKDESGWMMFKMRKEKSTMLKKKRFAIVFEEMRATSLR